MEINEKMEVFIMKDVKIRFVGMSKNAKTGMISQTYTTCNTCPTRCPFKENGCYAKMGHVRLCWDKTSEMGVVPKDLKKLIDSTPHTNIIRHNVAGDIAKEGTSDIDEKLVKELVKAYKGLKAYTYTHCTINERNLKIAKEAIANGFVINFSTENVASAKKAKEAGVPVVIACNTIHAKTVKKEGLTIQQCPATLDKGVTCATCGKCWNKSRKSVIAFPVHGAGKKKAINAGFLADL